VLPRRLHGYPCDWIMPAWEPIDPLKDMEADVLAVRTGRMTWNQFVSSWGIDPTTQLDAIEAWLKELDTRKIVLDSDPRRPIAGVKGAATTPAPAPGAAGEPAPAPTDDQ
jgi:capsid protein